MRMFFSVEILACDWAKKIVSAAVVPHHPHRPKESLMKPFKERAYLIDGMVLLDYVS